MRQTRVGAGWERTVCANLHARPRRSEVRLETAMSHKDLQGEDAKRSKQKARVKSEA